MVENSGKLNGDVFQSMANFVKVRCVFPALDNKTKPDMKSIYTMFAVAALGVVSTAASAQSSKQDRIDQVRIAKGQAMVKRDFVRNPDAHVIIDAAARGGVANDECTGAISLTPVDIMECGTSAVTGDNSAATQSGAGPGCDETTEVFQDVWYSFNSGSHESLIVGVVPGTMEDLVVEVLEATCTGTAVYCEIGTGANTVVTTPNTQYLVRVASNNQYGVGGTFEICVAYMQPATNDDCADAIALTVGETCSPTAATLAGATQSMDPSTCGEYVAEQANDVWFSFVAAAGFHTVIVGSNEDISLDVLEGTCGNATSIICADNNSSGGEQLTLSDLVEGTTYYVRVYAWAAEVSDPIFDICVVAAAPVEDDYCMAGADGTGLGLNERIVNVEFAGINNPSADVAPVAPAYASYISEVGEVAAGGTYPVTVTVSSTIGSGFNSNQVLAWIDFNQNDVLDHPSEEVFISEIGALAEYTGYISIPATATLGTTRLRFRLHDTHDGSGYMNVFNDTPCGLASYGEVEDYSVNITPFTGVNDLTGPAFSVFPNPTNGDITISGADLSGTVLFELTDMTGRIVYSERRGMVAKENVVLPIAGKVAAGTYNLSLMTAQGRSVRTVVVR